MARWPGTRSSTGAAGQPHVVSERIRVRRRGGVPTSSSGSNRADDPGAGSLPFAFEGDAQEEQQITPCAQPMAPQRARCSAEVPLREHERTSTDCPTRRLYVHDRLEERVSSRAGTPRFKAFLGLSVERKLLPIQGSTLRSVSKPLLLYESSATGGPLHTCSSASEMLKLRGRLAFHENVPGGDRNPQVNHPQTLLAVGIDDQLHEVGSGHLPATDVRRIRHRHVWSHAETQSTEEEATRHRATDPSLSLEGTHEPVPPSPSADGCATGRRLYRSDQRCGSRQVDVTRPVQGSASGEPVGRRRVLVQESDQGSPSIRTAPTRVERQSSTTANDRPRLIHGCLGQRMGSYHVRPNSERHVEETGAFSHQPEGTGGGSIEHTVFRKSAELAQSLHTPEDRQHNDCMLRKQLWWKSAPAHIFERTAVGTRGERTAVDPRRVHQRQEQHGCRPPQSYSRPRRLVPDRQSVPCHRSTVWTSPRRPVCVIPEQEAEKIQLQVGGPICGGRECTHTGVEGNTQFRQCPFPSTPGSVETDSCAESDSDGDCTFLASTTLVSDTASVDSGSPDAHSEHPTVVPARSVRGDSGASAQPQVDDRRLASVWTERLKGTWPAQAIQLATATLTDGTTKKYFKHISELRHIAQSQSWNPLDECCIATYMEVATRATARPESTLRMISAAVSYFADATGTTGPVFTPALKRLKQGIVVTRTTQPRRQTPLIDINVLVTHLRSLGANDRLTLADLRKKSIVLLCVALFARPSDLATAHVHITDIVGECTIAAALDITQHHLRTDGLHWQQDGSLEVQFYGSKSDRAMNAQPVRISHCPADPTVCPVRTLRAYLDATDHLRDGPGPVFLSLRRPYDGLSASRMSEIITMCCRQAGLEATAKSLRPSAATAALTDGARPDIVQRHGRWKSTEVFNRHYAGDKYDFSAALFQ